MNKKILLRIFLLLAFRTKAKKIKAMRQNLVSGFPADLIGQTFQANEIGVHDLFAPHANHVWMRIGLIAIVAVASLRKPELQDFIQFCEERDGLVNRCKAGGGKIPSYLLKDRVHAGMSVTRSKNLEDGQPLRGDAEPVVSQFQKHLFQACRWISQMNVPSFEVLPCQGIQK